MNPSEKSTEYDSVAEYYDHMPPYRDRPDVAFFVELARESGGPVLELGCGTGRVLIPTARAGVEIVGLDSSAAMMAICRAKLAAEPPAIQAKAELMPGDLRRFDLGRQFALVTTPFRPFQHLLSVEDQLACLGCIRRHLTPGGRFILDIFNPSVAYLAVESLPVESAPTAFTMPDGRRVVRRDRTLARDLFNQVQDIELAYHVTHPDGREEEAVHRFLMRYLFRFEAEHLLARAGFAVESVYADFDKNPYGSKYPGELIFVARPGQPA